MNLTALSARPVADLRAWWCGDIAGGVAAGSPCAWIGQAVFIVPRYSASVAHERGIPPERLVAINAEETITFPGGFSPSGRP